jgi:hypothetical protein
VAVRVGVDMVSGGSIPQYRPMISTELQAERVLIKMKKGFFADESFFIVSSSGTFVIRHYFLAYDRPHTQTEREFNGLPKAERVRLRNEYYEWERKFINPPPPKILSRKQARKLKKQSNSGNSGIIYCPYVPAIVSTNTGP